MSKFWKLLIAVVLFSVGSQLIGQDVYDTPEEVDSAITKQEMRENNHRIQKENQRWKEDKVRLEVYRKDIPKQRPWVSDMRHKKIRMKYKMNHHMRDERKKKFKRKVKQRRLITFLTGMVVGYHIGAK